MKQFKVFKHPIGEIQAVKQGWCWPAFFFNFIWAMDANMPWLGVGTLLFFIVISIVVDALGNKQAGDALSNLVPIASYILFGVHGNRWREKNLVSRGFELKDTATATTKDDAIALFLKQAAV